MYSHMNSTGSTVATKIGHVPPGFDSILHGFHDLSSIVVILKDERCFFLGCRVFSKGKVYQ
jgi:hypothetical protein